MIDVRDNWRILMLVVLCIIAALALFGPLGAGGESDLPEEERQFTDPTNLQYGLQLSGGTQIRGQLIGMTAETVPVEFDAHREVQLAVADELGLDPIDVSIRDRGGNQADVEVYASEENVTREEFAAALNAADVDASVDDIRGGVTRETRTAAVDTLTERLDRTGLSGASVTTVSAATGGHFIVAEVPGADRETVEELLGEPGRVQIIAGYPDGGELVMEEILTTEDFAGISTAEPRDEHGPPRVPVSLEPEAGERFADLMRTAGFTGQGIGQCDFNATVHDEPREGQWCLYTALDGELVYGASMSANLAQGIDASDFESDPRFQMRTTEFSDAQQLEVNLRAGALPTELNIQSANFISPSLAQLFKPLALATAIAAWITVALVVYVWYRDIRVAVPMFLTATSEVFLLLGFAAAIGMALDLSHIAGFIAVIGTGLDDLIIMADEILQRKKDVKTGRVFQSRFRKAFWIIGMAAATTIIAMSPLAVMSLGDLQGFAIVTIVGVLIGVGITRPAYGDVLRHLMLDDVKRA